MVSVLVNKTNDEQMKKIAIANLIDFNGVDICANKPCGAQISDLEYAKFMETFDGDVNPISYVDGRAPRAAS